MKRNHEGGEQPSGKIPRKAREKDFCLTISSPASFKNMCDIMDSILKHFHFQVVKTAGFEGLKIRQLDESQSALLSIRYSCQVDVREKRSKEACGEGEIPDDDLDDSWSFCVDKKVWRGFMKQINNTAILQICQYRYKNKKKKQDAKEKNELITILANDEEYSGKHKYECNTLDVTLDDIGEANEINTDQNIALNLEECKKFWRLCSSQDCETIRFRFLRPPFETMKDGVFHMSFHNECRVSGSRMFHSKCVHDTLIADSKTTVNEEEDYVEWKETYNQAFPVKMLNTFTKNLEKEQRLSIALTQDNPLVINYNLGIENSYIRFWVAPKVEEEE